MVSASAFRAFALCGLLLSFLHASATAMMEPHRIRTVVTYANGDELNLLCPLEQESCSVAVRVNGVDFHFSQEEVGAVILPYGGTLFSGEHSGRDRYFSLELSVECADASGDICKASMLVEQGKVPQVNIHSAR